MELILAALGITARGLFLGLYTFLWRLWAAASFLWVGFVVLVFWFYADEGEHAGVYAMVALVPPVLLLLAEGILASDIGSRSVAPSSRTFPRISTDESEEERIAQNVRP